MSPAITLVLLLGAMAPATRPNEAKDFGSAEKIRAHLEAVAQELRAQTPASLAPDLRARRLWLLERLLAYARAGRFPHNHVAPGRQQPIFIDPHGTACAVGQLIIDSGARDLAQHLSLTRNQDYLLEMEDEALARWVARSGFSARELARIQPNYTYYQWSYAVVGELDGETLAARAAVSEGTTGAFDWLVSTRGAVLVGESTWFLGDPYGNRAHRIADCAATTEPVGDSLAALQGAGGTLWAATGAAIKSRRDDGTWVEALAVGGGALWVNGPSDLWVVGPVTSSGSLTVSHFDGLATATEALPTSVGGSGVYSRSLWASATGEAWVAITYYDAASRAIASAVFRRDAGAWSQVDTGGVEASAVFGSGSDAWVLGKAGAVLRWNGTSLERESTGTEHDLFAGVVRGDGSVVAVGEAGTVLLRSPSGAWRRLPSDTVASFVSATLAADGRVVLGVDGEGSCRKTDRFCPSAPATTDEPQTAPPRLGDRCAVPGAPPTGCGCASATGPGMVLAALALVARRRRRAQSTET